MLATVWQNFLYEAHPITGNGNEFNLLRIELEKLIFRRILSLLVLL
jgi:hypothetical protein